MGSERGDCFAEVCDRRQLVAGELAVQALELAHDAVRGITPKIASPATAWP